MNLSASTCPRASAKAFRPLTLISVSVITISPHGQKLGLCLKPNPYLALVIKRSVETTVVQINTNRLKNTTIYRRAKDEQPSPES
jgi:hypothetical protein